MLATIHATASRFAPLVNLGWLRSPQVRRAALALSVLGFIAGIVLSLRAQPTVLQDLNLLPILLLVVLATPITTLLNGYEFMLSARIIGRRIGFRNALETTIVGSAANMLPLPGSTMVRVASLKASGASLKHSAMTTVLVGLVWLGVAFAYAGAWVYVEGPSLVGTLFIACGLLVLAGSIAVAIQRSRGWQIPARVVATKLALVLLDAGRMHLCLWALGTDANFAQASALTVSGVLGSAVSIVPAGLGIREAVAAAMAPIVALAASSAFLAASLNRLFGLATITPVAVVLVARTRGERP